MVEPFKACANGATFSKDACRAQVERIVQSTDFDATTRERRFLQYVVDETLAGRGARIKAYSIATEVFERSDSFDPQNDPIVRIEAGRLRRALERYYLTAGIADTLVVTIPKGGYVPVFSEREPVLSTNPVDTAAATASPAWPRFSATSARGCIAIAGLLTALFIGIVATISYQRQTSPADSALMPAPEPPRLLVEPFDSFGATQQSADVATGLTQEVIGQLSRFKDVTVVTVDVETATPIRYELQGSVSFTTDTFRLLVRLVNRSDGAILWAESYEGDLVVSDLVNTQVEIADSVAATLAQVDGVIFHAEVRNRHQVPPENWASYNCILSFHSFRASLETSRLPKVQQCLETTVQRFPDYATAWALLALVELDVLRSKFPYNPAVTEEVVARVLSHARRAVALDPHNVRGLQAEMLALYYDRQFEAGRKVGERALAMNPNDSELINEYGARLALSGDWQTGCQLLSRTFELRPTAGAYSNINAILCAYFDGDLVQAKSLIGALSPRTHPLKLLVAAVVYGEAGDDADAEKVRALMQQTAPSLLADARFEVEARLGSPDDIEKVMQSLVKAGLTDTAASDRF